MNREISERFDLERTVSTEGCILLPSSAARGAQLDLSVRMNRQTSIHFVMRMRNRDTMTRGKGTGTRGKGQRGWGGECVCVSKCVRVIMK